MVLREHIDAFRIYLSDATGRPSDEITYPNRLIAMEIISAANALVREVKASELFIVSPTICVEMAEVDLVECPCGPAKGCTYMKSVRAIPFINELPQDVSTADGFITYTYLDWSKFSHMVNSRTKAEREGSYYTIKTLKNESHIYVYHLKNSSNMRTIQVTATPLDPIGWEAVSCGNDFGIVCRPMDVQLNIPQYYANKLFSMVAQKLGIVVQLQGQRPDILNNDSPDAKAPMNPVQGLK
jgi:hypothetical protein